MPTEIGDENFVTKFLLNLEVQYEKFQAFTREQIDKDPNGLKADNVFINKIGGMFLFLKPSNSIQELVGQFSLNAKQVLDDEMMIYTPEMAHTTIFVSKQGHGYKPSQDDEVDMIKLFSAGDLLIDEITKRGRIAASYDYGFGFNETTLILMGKPLFHFVETISVVISHAQELGLKVKMPWGAHITVGRFIKEHSPEQASCLAELCKSWSVKQKNLKEIHPYVDLCAGFYTVQGNQFQIQTTRSWKI
jgi:hypothetical protein